MIASDYKDLDGFKLQFEENCPKKDKEYFVKEYPLVDTVAEKKLHCTTCDFHIGTAPLSEKVIRTHLILGVTQCNKCFAFYNSGEFGKGEDGSEYYCRWCGQGGEVFCCSTCPFVFCNKCIRSNLSGSYVKEIEENDEWSCFVCDKEILKNQRAQHWALRNFMNKQLEKIQKTNVSSEDELNNLLNEDVSNCCPRKPKRKSVVKPSPAPVKRPSMNGSYMNFAPPAKKPYIQQPAPAKAKSPQVQYRSMTKALPTRTPPMPARPGPKQTKSDIVCTPDIMGIFNGDNDDSAIPTTNMMPSTSVAPPPLVMRNNPRPVVRPILPNPIYHNVNGFQIDLNHASRQEIFRLPNGKLIQVRKQTAPTPSTNFSVRPGAIIAPRGPQFTIRQAAPTIQTTARMFRPSAPQTRIRANNQPQQRFTFSDGRVLSTPIIPPAPVHAPPQIPTPSTSTIFTQQNGSISVARAVQPDTPFGKSKTEFEDKIISGMEICQHTINKMITLSNSTSFKTSRSFSDLKDLYIHLQYLFTYTSGKFTTLQESLKTGMESLAQFDERLKEKCDDDDLEIVEQKTDIIEVMSDEEEENAAKAQKPGPVCSKKPQFKHIQYQPENAGNIDIAQQSGISVLRDFIAQDECSNSSSLSSDIAKVVASDKKLSNKVLVKVEKLEDTKNLVIKEYVLKLQARLEKQKELDSSRETTPEIAEAAADEAETNAAIESIEDEMNVAAEEKEVSAEVIEDENKEKSAELSEVPDASESQETLSTTEVISIDIDDDAGEPNMEKVQESPKVDQEETFEKIAENPVKETSETIDDEKANEDNIEIPKETSEKPEGASDEKEKEEEVKEDEETEIPEEAEKSKVSEEIQAKDAHDDEGEQSEIAEEVQATTPEKSEPFKLPEEIETMETCEKVEPSKESIEEEIAITIEDLDKDVEPETCSVVETQTAGAETPENLKDDKTIQTALVEKVLENPEKVDDNCVIVIGSSQETLDLDTTSIISLNSTIELDEEIDEEKSEQAQNKLSTDSSSITETTHETSDVKMNEPEVPEDIVSGINNELQALSAAEGKSVISAAEEETLLNSLIDTLSQESLMEID